MTSPLRTMIRDLHRRRGRERRGLALAEGSGTFHVDGRASELKHAYAYGVPDPFEEG